jgi:nuclear migration protein JNM1
VKEELERKRAQNEEGKDGTDPAGALEDGVEGLSRLLDSLSSSARGGSVPTSAEGSLSKKISTGPRPSQPQSNGTKPSLLAVQQSTAHSPSAVLSQAAAFERRLALLEAILGSPSSSTLTPDTNTPPTHILPTLTTLSNQLTILTKTITPTPSNNPSHLDDLSSRIAKLKANADTLTTARKDAAAAAKEAANAESHLPSPPSPSRRRHSHKSSFTSNIAPPPMLEDSTHTAKIHALHSTLPTINALSPLLPSVLERLRSLRSMHAGAATASEDLEALEKGQEDLRAEIARWREGLDEVERKVREGEMAMGRNLETVGKWVGALEERAKQLRD